VDFTSPPPFVSAELLRRCEPLPEEAAWDLAIGDRIEAVVRLAMRSSGSEILVVPLRCPSPGCKQAIEIEITSRELREWSASTAPPVVGEVRGRTMRLRRPTGRDQRAWLAAAWRDRDTARHAMIGSLIDAASETLDGDTLTAAEAALARIDPLVDFTLTVTCP